MAEFTRNDTLELDKEEIGFLLSLIGLHSPSTIRQLNLDVEVFEHLYSVFTECAYAPMFEESPNANNRVSLKDVFQEKD